MKIDGNAPTVNPEQLNVQDRHHKKKDVKENKVQPVDSVEDRLELSTDIRKIESYQKIAQEAPEVRTERVNELKEKVDTQTYNIKAEEVAESLITGSIVDELA